MDPLGVVDSELGRAQPPKLADPVKRERLARSLLTLSGLRDEVLAWISARQKKDKHAQYVTQLNVLSRQFKTMFSEIETGLRSIPSMNTRQFYERCREQEGRLMWVRRVYDWYRSKFDQRDDPALRPALEAADEVVWSCYAQPFRAVQSSPPAVPLPFLEPTYIPSAIPRIDPPQDLRSDINAEFFRRMLNELPVPVIALPWMCADEPWWLAFAAHEVGHHVELDLPDHAALETVFACAVAKAGGERWRGWQAELFADLYSVLMLGPWASWALAELVWGDDERMLNDSHPRYPSSLTRLLFMNEVAKALAIDSAPALRGIEPAELLKGREAAGEERTFVATVAAAALASGDELGTPLRALCDFQPLELRGETSDVALWSKALRREGNMGIQQTLRSARLVVAASVCAWAAISEVDDDDKRAEQRQILRDETLRTIVASREEITREATEPAAATVKETGERLIHLIHEVPIP